MVVTSEEIKTEDQSSFKDNRAPKCARCRNHGVVNSLKGHKHFCQWKNCTCPRCQVVVERQKITAERVAFLRYQRKMKSQKGFNGKSDFVPTTNKYVDLDGMKYLDEINKPEYSTINDFDSERNSSGTPASLSPPGSPQTSPITSNDVERKRSMSPKANSLCTDPNCTECWSNSPYMLNTKLDRLRTFFPMLTVRTLEDTLTRFKGNLPLAIDHLLKSLKTSDYENSRTPVCRDPNCRECELFVRRPSPQISEDVLRRSASPEFSRKRPQSYSPLSYDIPAKRSPSSYADRMSPDEIRPRASPVVELYTPLSKENSRRPETKSKIILPPTLLKKCIDCSSTISADDKFCRKCGCKQDA